MESFEGRSFTEKVKVPAVELEEALSLIDRIDEAMAKKIQFASLSPDVFRTLNDANASRREIEMIESKINESVNLRLRAIASSVYFGTMRRGDIGSFYDVVNCLGTSRTKALLFILSNHSQGIMDQEVETIFARSYATAVMAEILASQTGFREDGIRKAELCALFLEIGRRFMVVYRKLYPGDAEKMDEDFIDAYHPYLGDKIVGRYALPDYVRTVILARNLIVEENHFSLAGLVYLARDTVHASFRQNNNRLVMKCQVPRPGTDVTRTLEAIVTEKFKAVGLQNYLHVIRIPMIQDL
jgi:HD-GYP domain-containing protein (c-di-GMP phosphodiesterase class II)